MRPFFTRAEGCQARRHETISIIEHTKRVQARRRGRKGRPAWSDGCRHLGTRLAYSITAKKRALNRLDAHRQGANHNMTPGSRATAVEQQFQRIADETIRRTERIHCTLEQRQQGLGTIINALQSMLRIVTEQRLRS
jgi:hypothetical protein